MVKIRLSRGGSKKRPFYHVVATNSKSARDGKYIERLGYYNPGASDKEEDININQERLTYWESVGAQLSDRVKKLVKLLGLSREERDAQRKNKLDKKQLKREELKAAQVKEAEPEAETEAEPEAVEEETPAEEPEAETEAEPEAVEEETPAEEPEAETEAEPEAVEEETPAEDSKKNKDESA